MKNQPVSLHEKPIHRQSVKKTDTIQPRVSDFFTPRKPGESLGSGLTFCHSPPAPLICLSHPHKQVIPSLIWITVYKDAPSSFERITAIRVRYYLRAKYTVQLITSLPPQSPRTRGEALPPRVRGGSGWGRPCETSSWTGY